MSLLLDSTCFFSARDVCFTFSPCLPGRNRKLHGLAAAIIKLWERCEIAKIAVKRGVQNTNSELMSEELKVSANDNYVKIFVKNSIDKRYSFCSG